MKPPHNVAMLERSIRALAASNEEGVQIRVLMANVIAGQFLEGAVMRGGGSLKLRYGKDTTRYTMDFDASRNIGEDEFVNLYGSNLSKGWNGFSGRIVKIDKAMPRNVPEQYVMQPFEVKLAYRDHPWCTVDLELSYNEIGDAEEGDCVTLPEEILAVFRKLGFPDPKPFPLMRIVHQVAQKLHGVTDPDSVRVQDLIDLQLMIDNETLDFLELRGICERLFSNRKKQVWPPVLTASDQMAQAYVETKGNLVVIDNIDDAVAWANKLIAQIASAR